MRDRRFIGFEPLECRTLLSTSWGASATLIHQDTAASAYPGITGKGISVAVIDTGIDYNDAALGGGFGAGHKVVAGYNFADGNGDPLDTFGHGTEVAGIIAADRFTVSGKTYQGVAPDANLIALKVADGSETVQDSTIDQALQWILSNYKKYNIAVVNFSFGGGMYDSSHTEPLVSADFQKIRDLGILIVSPSGNGGTGSGAGIEWPAADPSVVSVGSVSLADQISTFTQRGKLLDLLAPGESVGTTEIGSTGLVSLTSFCAPVVSGLAALIKSADPTLKADDMYSILRASGEQIDDSSFTTLEHYARVDVFDAVTMTLQRAPNAGSDVGVNGAASSMAFDAQGVLNYVYYDTANATIKYATRSTSGVWSATRIVDTTGNNVGATLSLALDPLGKPSIAYYNATSGDLDYARFDGIKWHVSALDTKNTVGQFPSLAFDPSGNPIVSYYRKTSGDLRVMRSNGTTWTRANVDVGGDVGQFDDLSISSSGTIGVAYADGTNGDVKYAQLSGSTWTPQLVDDLRGTAFISLAFDHSNHPAVSYYDAYPANLKFATFNGTSWQTQTIGSHGAQGLFTNLYYDNTGAANIVYLNRTANAVFHLTGSIGNWTASTLDLAGGADVVIAVTSDDSAAVYGYLNAAKMKLFTGAVI